MRVVWISAGLLAAIIAVLFVTYEPEPSQPQLASSENPESINPFAEEKPVATVNVDNTEVTLAVLPADAAATTTGSSDQQVGAISEQASPSAESPTTENAAAAISDTAPAMVEAIVEADVAKDINLSASSVESLVVVEPQEQAKDEKKPGLAMIALEKENNREKIAVIVHESNTQQLTEEEIKALYLDRLTRWRDGSRVMLFDLPLGDKYRDKFSRSILKMTALEADFQESKRRELRIKANDVEVKAKNVIVSYVEQNPNAVAYVPLNLVRDKSSVKVVLTIP